MRYEQPRFRGMGDRGLLVELGSGIDPHVHAAVKELLYGLNRHAITGLKELVPSYSTVLMIYDPLTTSQTALEAVVRELPQNSETPGPEPQKVWEVPVVYGGPHGPDLEWVAAFHKLTVPEVIRLHTAPVYRVYLIGFSPGFPYLGELPPSLVTPRKEAPRTLVAKGSVGIAQNQTGIYPHDSPGGWQILGWTPLRLFDPDRDPPVLLHMGDQVKFIAVEEEEMASWNLPA